LVANDAPICRKVVTHEVDGLLVPVKDAAALADVIERLHQDPALARPSMMNAWACNLAKTMAYLAIS
jgi:glycosyltransferase involved in cell wall biosynthesis